MKEREVAIDILRFFAIIGIIIAHTTPSPLFVQIRGFDVVLMVFLSAVCTKKFDEGKFNYFAFLVKRCIRLILPVWLFFILYYIGIYLFYYLPPINDIVASFTFTSDRYVWIIRILVVLSILAPFIWQLTHRLSSTALLIILFSGLVLSEYLFCVYSSRIYDMIFMTIPYGLVYILGMNVNCFSKKMQLALAYSFLSVFIILFIYLWVVSGECVLTSVYKYPPHFYYMSYALAVTLLMWVYRNQIACVMHKLHLRSFASYVGSHTYWLYLWHIPIVDVVQGHFNPFIRFFIIFGVAMSIVIVQDKIVNYYIKNKTWKSVFNG